METCCDETSSMKKLPSSESHSYRALVSGSHVQILEQVKLIGELIRATWRCDGRHHKSDLKIWTWPVGLEARYYG